MITVAYIGNGKSVNRYHLPYILQRKETYRVKKIYNHTIDNPKWCRQDGIEYTNNIDDLLLDEEIELIIVCTRPKFHFDYAKKVLNSNKHCLVEKPFTETSKQAKELFDLAIKKDLIIQPYQNRRFDSDFLTIQKVIESGKLGELFEVEMNYDCYRPEIGNYFVDYRLETSFLYGHGCHTIDQAVSYFGKPDKVTYDVRQLGGENKLNDYFDLDLFYKNLKVSIRSSYFRVKARSSFILYGKKGYFEKITTDRQETHLKANYFPNNIDFGQDKLEHFGLIVYYDDNGDLHEERIESEIGDYGRVYDDLYTVITKVKPKVIKDDQILIQMKIIEQGLLGMK